MSRFAVLTHDWPTPHLDLLLERDGVLKAWRLPPDFDPTSTTAVPAEPLGDHRLHYLDYEGPVSGDRGTVSRWDAGELVWEEWADARAVVGLSGARLIGRWELIRTADGRWQFRRLE